MNDSVWIDVTLLILTFTIYFTSIYYHLIFYLIQIPTLLCKCKMLLLWHMMVIWQQKGFHMLINVQGALRHNSQWIRLQIQSLTQNLHLRCIIILIRRLGISLSSLTTLLNSKLDEISCVAKNLMYSYFDLFKLIQPCKIKIHYAYNRIRVKEKRKIGLKTSIQIVS